MSPAADTAWGVATGDYDNDGDPDLYVTNFGRDILYRNDGDGTFSDATADVGLSGAGWSTGAAFLDYDRDGRLDLFVARYLDWSFSKNVPCGPGLPERRSYCHPRRFAPVTHLLFHNVGNGKFENVSGPTAISKHPGKGLGVAVGDYDGDGWVDIFVANDSYPQQLFRNLEGTRFEEAGVAAGIAYDADGREFAGMGIAFADYDNDTQPDLFVNALARQSYWLFRNQAGSFSSVTAKSGLGGITDLHSGWGTGLVDFDNDGWRDLFVAQGHVMDDIELSDPSGTVCAKRTPPGAMASAIVSVSTVAPSCMIGISIGSPIGSRRFTWKVAGPPETFTAWKSVKNCWPPSSSALATCGSI